MCYIVVVPKVRNILNNFNDGIERLTGKNVACKHNANTNATLFNKYGVRQSSQCTTSSILFDDLGNIVLPPDNFTQCL